MSRGYVPILELGRGGMGDVLLAVATGPGGINKLHVVKRLRSDLAQNAEFLAMFFNEARIAARIDHPNVVQTYEVGFDGEHHYSAMEYLEGQSLESLFTRGGAQIAPEIYLAILCDALSGLHHAHELCGLDGSPLRVVHRDVSPHNIFVTYEGQAKLLDFGIAKAADSVNATRTGAVKGKMAYMPLEQLERGPKFDRRADLFAIGAILFRIITGQRLWKGMSDIEIYVHLTEQGVPSPRSLRPDAPDELAAICERALAIDPDDRYSTALELQQALEGYLERSGAKVMPHQVGGIVAELFAEERAKVSATISSRFEQGVLIAQGAATPPMIPAFGVPFDSEGKLMSAEALGPPDSVPARIDPPINHVGGRPTVRIEAAPRAPLSTDITAPVTMLTESRADMLLVDVGWPGDSNDPAGRAAIDAARQAGELGGVWPSGGALTTGLISQGSASSGERAALPGMSADGASEALKGQTKGPANEWVRAWAIPALATFALAALVLAAKGAGLFSSGPEAENDQPVALASAGTLVLRVVATPSNASVRVDKRPLEQGVVSYAKGETRHHISVEAPGHQPYADWVELREPQTTLRVTLKPTPARGKAPPADVVREEGPG